MKKKIFLSEREKIMPVEKLAKKFNVSVSTIHMAKRRGWFYQGFRDLKFKGKRLPPRRKSKFKNLIPLTDEDRRMSLSQIAMKFNVSASTASNARKNGWIAQKLGPSVNAFSDGKLPSDVLVEDLILDVGKSARWVLYQFGFNKQETDDIKQEMIIRLLEQTAAINFVNPKWRRKFAYYAGVKYITRKVFAYNSRFSCLDLEENLFDKDNFSEVLENRIDYEDVISRLSPKNKDIIKKWLYRRKSKRIPQLVIKILKQIKTVGLF